MKKWGTKIPCTALKLLRNDRWPHFERYFRLRNIERQTLGATFSSMNILFKISPPRCFAIRTHNFLQQTCHSKSSFLAFLKFILKLSFNYVYMYSWQFGNMRILTPYSPAAREYFPFPLGRTKDSLKESPSNWPTQGKERVHLPLLVCRKWVEIGVVFA